MAADMAADLRLIRRHRGSWRPRAEAPAFALAAHVPEVIARLAAAWRQLREDERRSVVGASLVAADLARLRAPTEILGSAARLIEDEIRHVEVCTRVLECLGVPSLDGGLRDDIDRPSDAEEVETRCARALLAGFAVGEPMSAACFAAARRLASEPLLHWALTELLRDEARHGPFAIRAGAWVVRAWTTARRQTLWPACVHEMERFERSVGGPVPSPATRGPAPADSEAPSSASLETLGLLGPGPSCAAAIASIVRQVLPSLAALGITPSLTPFDAVRSANSSLDPARETPLPG